MVVQVQNLVGYMKKVYSWYEEANGILSGTVVNNNDLTVEEIENWKTDIINQLDKQLIELKRISCNKTLITNWERRIGGLKNDNNIY